MIKRVGRCLQRFAIRFFTLMYRDVPIILSILPCGFSVSAVLSQFYSYIGLNFLETAGCCDQAANNQDRFIMSLKQGISLDVKMSC